MADAMAGLDAWLEAPYVRAAEEGDAYVAWCENEGLDPEGDHTEAYEAARDDYDGPDPDDARDAAWDRAHDFD